MKNKRSLKEKGITLVALIVTIIILLILAGITIAQLTESGLFEKAKLAREENEIANAKEKIMLALYEYEANMKKETIYRILNKIEGLDSINPDDELAELPYTIVVDGYEFLITEEKEVIYQGKIDGIKPQIESIEKNVINENEVKIVFKATTKDSGGIKEIILIKDDVEIETKEVSGKEITDEFEIKGNGTYKIKLKGKNGKQVISEEIEITEIAKISGTLRAGTVVDGIAQLTVTAETKETNIAKIEIYEGTKIVKEIAYEEPIQNIEEIYQTNYISFYQESSFMAKIISTDNETIESNTVKTKNTDSIKTVEDLKKLATLVNTEGMTFEGKTINQISDIDLSTICGNAIGSWEPIGYASASSYWFNGTYDGNSKNITNIYIDNTEDKSVGLFGFLGYNGIIKNLSLSGEIVQQSEERVAGGIVGRNEGTIENCINNADVTHISNNRVGGIAGNSLNSIKKCINNGKIKGTETSGGIVGFSGASETIISETKAVSTDVKIIECENYGTVTTSSSIAGGIVGYSQEGNITGCKNKGDITSEGCPENGTETQGTGGIAGRINNSVIILTSSNTGDITATTGYFAGGIIGYVATSESGGGRIGQCYNDNGNISVEKNGVGGIVGRSDGFTINNCYNYLSSSNYIKAGGYNAGGIIGVITTNKTNINNCYNIGENIASAGSNAAIVGNIATASSSSTIKNCYYLSSSSLNGIGAGTVSVNNIVKKAESYFILEASNNQSVAYLLSSVDGNAGIWEQNSSINRKYPYLVYNVPD